MIHRLWRSEVHERSVDFFYRIVNENVILPSVCVLINAGIFSSFRIYLFDNGTLWMRVSKRPIVSSYKPRNRFPSFKNGQNYFISSGDKRPHSRMLVDQKCRHFEYVRSKIKFLAMAFFDKGFFGLTRMNKGLSSMAGSIFIATIINSRFLNWELSKDLIDKYKLHFESLQRFPLNKYQYGSIRLRRVRMPTQLVKVNGLTS